MERSRTAGAAWRDLPQVRYSAHDTCPKRHDLLFFNLVWLAVIAQLAHHLAQLPLWSGAGWFVSDGSLYIGDVTCSASIDTRMAEWLLRPDAEDLPLR